MVYVSGASQLLNPTEVFTHLELRPGMRVAEFGCGGAGHFVLPAAQAIGQQGLVYAFDIRQTALSAVASRARLMSLGNVKTVWANLETPGATRLPDASVDVVMLINLLFQTDQHPAMATEAVRILKPGGQALAIDWAPGATPLGPPAEHRVTSAAVKKIFTDLGLRAHDEFQAGPYHFGIVFEK
jgi:ubiquinone/menaquinone biosynthesis C-methylase UbiE